jgi:hypothetical protein
MKIGLLRSMASMLVVVGMGLPGAAMAQVVVTFDDPVVTPGAGIYEWDYAKDGTTDVRFLDLTRSGFSPFGPGTGQKYVSQPGLEGGIIVGPEIRIDFLGNWGAGQGIQGPFSFGFALNTTTAVPLAVTFSIYDEDGDLLEAMSASAFRRALAGGGLSNFSEGFVSLPNPPVKAWYGLVDFNDEAPAGRYFFDNFAYVPEPATWGMMIVGFGLIGSALRRREAKVA